MSELNIRVVGDPVLRRKAKPVVEFGEQLEELAGMMVELMIANEGIGLAAPQLGIERRFIVIGVPVEEDEDARKIYAISNPEILESSAETAVMEEGCLSVPGIFEELERPKRIRLRYQELDGEEKEIRVDGLLARVIQHEMDHLEGILFIDHLSSLQRSLVKGKLDKLREEASAHKEGS